VPSGSIETTTLEKIRVGTSQVKITDEFNSGSYEVYFGVKFKRITSHLGDNFYINSFDYTDNIATNTGDWPDEWTRLGTGILPTGSGTLNNVYPATASYVYTDFSYVKPTCSSVVSITIWIGLKNTNFPNDWSAERKEVWC
jgi:hypothetical protein